MFGIYTIMLIRHSIEGNKKTKNISDYFIGGRSLGGIIANDISLKVNGIGKN